MCQKPYRFSCWNKSDPNYASLSGARPIPVRELARARIAADLVIDGKAPDSTGGAMHHYALSMKVAPPSRGGEAGQMILRFISEK